ncbi:hypothetical protein BLNAU_19866 [Blattamonas nauphoetae]|uniref:Uncharacterized protein n=1 Tax=Blattamonas nauphoetae TaxID=2049346 RepID=A0ABQ9X0A9_9EUKA|nr:hypothetical protein BLNAU_19866 [Blattamonas nauphoetae]
MDTSVSPREDPKKTSVCSLLETSSSPGSPCQTIFCSSEELREDIKPSSGDLSPPNDKSDNTLPLKHIPSLPSLPSPSSKASMTDSSLIDTSSSTIPSSSNEQQEIPHHPTESSSKRSTLASTNRQDSRLFAIKCDDNLLSGGKTRQSFTINNNGFHLRFDFSECTYEPPRCLIDAATCFEEVGLITLNDSFSFAVSFSSSTFGRSAVIALGVSGSLAFGSEYKITTIKDSNRQPIQLTETTIKTPPKPSKLSLCVCGKDEMSGMEMSKADAETCAGLQSSWNTATSLGILDTTMRIVDSVDLTSPLIVTTRVPFTLISFQAEPATLRARISSSQPTSVLLSVEEDAQCRLTLLTITVDLSVSTFKLVSASKGTVVIRSCSIERTPHIESNIEDEWICGWSRGLIELIETDTELNGVSMREIEMGGIWMRGGKLKVAAGVFSQNGPSIADFPSARQNMHCEGEGRLVIDSLAKGDGTKNSPSAWLDASECTIEGDEDIARSPLFVPTLNSTESKVESDKSGKRTVKVVGKTLMPCGLSLEVFEWDSSKGIEGKSENIDLSTSSATHWNETEIIIPFSAADIPNLNKKMELRGRLVFGNDVRTENWMVVSELGSGNKSLGGVGSKWWIPVIICLSCALLVSLVIVVCVCMHRKRHSARNVLLMNEEMTPAQVEEEEKMKDNDPITDPPNSAISSLPSRIEQQSTQFEGTRFACDGEISPAQLCMEVIVCNEKMERSVAVETDTLFNALHNPQSTRFVEKRKVSQAIAKGLAGLVEMGVISEVVTRLSPHWVLFDKNDRVCLKMREKQSVAIGET